MLATDSDDETLLQHFRGQKRQVDPNQRRDLRARRRRRKRDPIGTDSDSPPVADLPPTAAREETSMTRSLDYVADRRDFDKWNKLRRPGWIWCGITRRYVSVFSARTDETFFDTLLLNPATRILQPVAAFGARDFGIRLGERSHPTHGPLCSKRPIFLQLFSHTDEDTEWDVATMIALGNESRPISEVSVISHGLGIRSVETGIVKSPVTDEHVLNVSDASETRLISVTRHSLKIHRCVMCETCSVEAFVPQSAFHISSTSLYNFTGPVAAFPVSSSPVIAAALCDNAIAWARERDMYFHRCPRCTSLSAMTGGSLLVGLRSGECLLVDSRLPERRTQHIGRVSAGLPSTVAQVHDLAPFSNGVPTVMARAVDGRVVVFDLRCSGKATLPAFEITPPIAEGYHQCDLSAGAVEFSYIRIGNQLRAVAVFSGGYHRLVAVDLITGDTLVDEALDGMTYSSAVCIVTQASGTRLRGSVLPDESSPWCSLGLVSQHRALLYSVLTRRN